MDVQRLVRLAATSAAAALVPLAPAAPAGAAGGKVLVVTTDHRRCADCSLPEASRPARFFTESPFSQLEGAFALRFTRLRWQHWGAATARAQGRVQLGRKGDAWRSARATLRLSRLRRHVRDGCGHDGTQRIYTRATIQVTSPRAFRGRFVVKLPATGCETA